jgi:hypothetical protein
MELLVVAVLVAVLWRAVSRQSDEAEARRWRETHPVIPPVKIVRRHCCHEHRTVVNRGR